MKDARSKARKESLDRWTLRDKEAEEVDRKLGLQTRSDYFRDVVRGRGGKLTPEQIRDIDDEGYHAGWSGRIPSWSGPYREGTQQSEIWLAGWKVGRKDLESKSKPDDSH